MASGSAKTGDFCSAYFRKHGRAPAPPSRRILECQAEAIARGCGTGKAGALAEIDLETAHESDIVRNVKRGDMVAVKAGRGELRLSFTHIDASGRLVCMAFNNGRFENEHHLREGEAEKAWCGMLADMRVFKVTIARLQLHHGAEGVLGCVRLMAEIDSAPVWPGDWPPR